MQPKYTAMAAALAAVADQLQKTADVYGKIDSQDASYRSMQQTVAQALALPEDADTAVPPPPVVLAAMTVDQFKDAVSQVQESVAGVVAAVADEIQRSDVAVLAAVAETRDDILGHIASTAEEPAAAAS